MILRSCPGADSIARSIRPRVVPTTHMRGIFPEREISAISLSIWHYYRIAAVRFFKILIEKYFEWE